MADVVEVNGITGIVIERDFTEEEIAQRVQDQLAQAEIDAAEEAVAQAKESARLSALDKLSALGLTQEEISATFNL